jgi:serine/threonine protein kinase
MHSIQGQPNPWVAFYILQRDLGATTYRETIRESLSPATTAVIPEAYLKLWRLRVAGMITLNLDAFPARAYNSVHPGKPIVTFTGDRVATHTHVLRNPSVPFLCHLHGQDSDTSTWVFTHAELSSLMKSEAYKMFISSVLTNSTVLFVGLSADDFAVGSHLKQLIDNKVDFGCHYWVTHRNDRSTDRWAEAMSVRTIFYHVHGNDHSEFGEMLDALAAYVPDDDDSTSYPPALLGSSLTPVPTLPPPDEVRKLSPDEIRTVLNQRALDILRPENSNRDPEFAKFVRDYGYAIHNAWYVSTNEGENSLVGYKLLERRNKGAFGQIFKAEDAEGAPVAIKLLKDEIRNDPLLLHSFRRGVQAMRILSEHNVGGMVAYKQTSEIPAFVAMDWIDGYDLRQAVEMKLLDSWEAVVEVALRIASILKAAHSLPERVLHRDLRPANIMLKRERIKRPWDVFLLDFDLSWYLGSIEQSVVHGSDAFGYLAPEQIRQRDGASSRHPAVDSYGLGMTLFFMISGTNPYPNQHLYETWEHDVKTAASKRKRATWLSMANRFARLILNMTHDRQSLRWDLAQIVLELERMRDAVSRPGRVRFADMLAEEVAARSLGMSGYEWDDDSQAAVLAMGQTGIAMELAGDDSRHRVELRVAKIRTDHEDRWKSGRRMNEAGQNIEATLRSGGWHLQMNKAGGERILFAADIDADKVAGDINRIVTHIDRVEALIPRM